MNWVSLRRIAVQFSLKYCSLNIRSLAFIWLSFTSTRGNKWLFYIFWVFFQENIILIKYTIQKRILHRQALSFNRSAYFSWKTISGNLMESQTQQVPNKRWNNAYLLLMALMQVISTLSLHREVASELGFRMWPLPVSAGQKLVYQSSEQCSKTHSSITELLSPLAKSLGLHYQNTERAVL